MRLFHTLMVAGSLAVVGTGASASTLLFNFEDANNGDKSYFNSGYLFDPVNLNSSTRCADDGPNPQQCFLEVTQGDPTVLQTADEIVEGSEYELTEEPFDLLGFYINFQGAGSAPDNEMVITSDTGGEQRIVVGEGYTDGGTVNDGTLSLFDDFVAIYLADDVYALGDAATAYEGAIEEQTGYFVVILDDYFDDITTFTWNASDGANNRVDCVAVSSTNTGVSLNDFQNCSIAPPPPPPPNEIPLPAAGWMLLAGLGGLAAMRKRRS